MSDDGDRRYDEREVSLVLARVAELSERTREDRSQGMSRAELEAVVDELGMDRSLVARASAELAKPEPSERLWGGPTRLRFETFLPGRAGKGFLEPAYDLLRRELGVPGSIEHSGGATIWEAAQGTTRRVHLTVREVEGGTVVRLEERMPVDARSSSAAGAFGGFFLGILSMIPLKALVAKPTLMMLLIPTWIVGVVAGWSVGRLRWRYESRNRHDQLQGLFRDLVELGERTLDPTALPASDDAEPDAEPNAKPDAEPV